MYAISYKKTMSLLQIWIVFKVILKSIFMPKFTFYKLPFSCMPSLISTMRNYSI